MMGKKENTMRTEGKQSYSKDKLTKKNLKVTSIIKSATQENIKANKGKRKESKIFETAKTVGEREGNNRNQHMTLHYNPNCKWSSFQIKRC
jgi:uncharacterized protein YgiM (DUF1202 family)